jgi:hypothetical protein
MIRKRPDLGWRALVFGAALFAVTLNFLQPLVHAAMMRGGLPTALWTIFCESAAAIPGNSSESVPAPSAAKHDCCLGLSHAPALIDPPATFLPVAFAVPAALFLPVREQPTPVGIRDGPHRPRGPPSLA